MSSVLRVTSLVAFILALDCCSGGISCGVGADDGDSTASSALQGGNDGNDDHKVTICHATGSATNPYVEITIDEHAVDAHRNHQDGRDIIPAPAEGCPGEGEGEAGEGEGEAAEGEGEAAEGEGECAEGEGEGDAVGGACGAGGACGGGGPAACNGACGCG